VHRWYNRVTDGIVNARGLAPVRPTGACARPGVPQGGIVVQSMIDR
jgi:hypothetical protein